MLPANAVRDLMHALNTSVVPMPPDEIAGTMNAPIIHEFSTSGFKSNERKIQPMATFVPGVSKKKKKKNN